MDISIIGAGGSVGRQIAIGVVREGLVPPNARLQLVGRRGGLSEQGLAGIATDLADAFAEDLPEIDLAYEPHEVLGDIVILAAGDAVARGERRSRADLAANNQAVVESYAQAIARSGHGEELLFVLTNPVEASVEWCCRYLDRRRVIGMGAYLDTLRFRQEIAHDLGVRRQRVQGLVLGEHGPRMVPCWSTVDVHGFEGRAGKARLASLQRADDPSVAEAIAAIQQTLEEKGAAAAYAHAEQLGPALRVVVKPYVTQFCGARSVASTAEMILRLLRELLSGGHVLTAAQVKLEGEFFGMHGVVGAPIVLTLNGVDRVVPYDLTPRERAQVKASLHVSEQAAPAGGAGRRAPAAATRTREGASQPWTCVLTMDSAVQPGTTERVSAAFAGRGISLDELQASPGAPPTMTLRFVATRRIQEHLRRRLARMRGVRSVVCAPATEVDPGRSKRADTLVSKAKQARVRRR